MSPRSLLNGLFIVAALALTALLILTALPLASTAAPRLEPEPPESLTALNSTEATERGAPLSAFSAPSAASVVQSPGTTTRISATLRSSPVMFIENVGQFDSRARFQVWGRDRTTSHRGLGYALWFDGSNDYVKLPDWNLDNLTLEARSNLNVQGTKKGILNRENDVQFGVVGSKLILELELELGAGNWVTLYSQRTLSENTWYHSAATYDGAAMKIFVNGELDNQRSASGSIYRNICTRYWVVGATYAGCIGIYDWLWPGTLDEIRVWDYARSQDEIQSAMNTALTGNEPGLVGYWRFDEGEGQTTTDSSGYGRDGRLGSTDGVDDNDPQWTASDRGIYSVSGRVIDADSDPDS